MANSENRQRLEQEQRLGLRLSQQQVRYVRLLEMTDSEVAQDMRRELDENPAIELRDTEREEREVRGERGEREDSREEMAEREERDELSNDDFSVPLLSGLDSATTRRGEFFQPAAAAESLYEALERQLDTMHLPAVVDMAARYIVGNIDGNGYLRRLLPQIGLDMLVAEGKEPSEDEMTQALEAVRSLDPAGVAAVDLRQSMELQLRRMAKTEASTDALEIICRKFDDLAAHRYSRLMPLVGNDRARLDRSLAVIHRLNPKPGASFGSAREAVNYVVPDFVIEVEDDELRVSLPGNLPELALSASFRTAVAEMEKRKRAGRDPYVLGRYNDAREYLAILQRRKQTLMDVMTAIAEMQHSYFMSGGDEGLLRPMALKDVAERTGLDISVVSRATKNKYASLPWATVPMRFFFSESFDAGAGGGEVSGRGVEQAIRAAVAGEDKHRPLSDDAICKLLREQGYDVSRRTVSKYRDRLNIPVARLRGER